jgi:hypothetical protein
VKLVIIERATGDNAGMKCVDLVSGLTQRDARTEANFESLIKEHHLVVDAKILMALAKGIEDRRGCLEMRDGLVVSTRNMAQHERLEGAIVDQPNAIPFRVSGRVG